MGSSHSYTWDQRLISLVLWTGVALDWTIQSGVPMTSKRDDGQFQDGRKDLTYPSSFVSSSLTTCVLQYPVSPPRPRVKVFSISWAYIFPFIPVPWSSFGLPLLFAPVLHSCLLFHWSQSPVTIMWFALEDVVNAVGALPTPTGTYYFYLRYLWQCLGLSWLRKCRETHTQERMPQLLRVVVPPSWPLWWGRLCKECQEPWGYTYASLCVC